MEVLAHDIWWYITVAPSNRPFLCVSIAQGAEMYLLPLAVLFQLDTTEENNNLDKL